MAKSISKYNILVMEIMIYATGQVLDIVEKLKTILSVFMAKRTDISKIVQFK